MEKQYRLKSYVIDLLSIELSITRLKFLESEIRSKEQWIKDNYHLNHLELVESNIEMIYHPTGCDYSFTRGGNLTTLTNQERSDIEWFLNTFGSMKRLYELAFEYYTGGTMIKGFKEWLNENNK